jgi:hypothetical protein
VKIKIDKKRHAQENIPVHGEVIPPNTKEIPCAAIKTYLQAPSIQTGHTRENNNTEKMWQKKSLAKLQSDTLRRQELQKSQSMQSTIDSRADFRDIMASKTEGDNQSRD